jgi:hypothetical protein
MNITLRTIWLVFALIISPGIICGHQEQSQEGGAKEIFYAPKTVSKERNQPESRPVPKRPTGRQPRRSTTAFGIRYWIELEGNGPVTDQYVFRTGDRIRLQVQSNTNGYFSIWAYAAEGPQPHFPKTELDNNFIKAGQIFSVPGVLRFSPPAGDEKFIIFFSKAKTDLPINDKELTASLKAEVGSKGLISETENRIPDKLGTYLVQKSGQLIAKQIWLKHPQ